MVTLYIGVNVTLEKPLAVQNTTKEENLGSK